MIYKFLLVVFGSRIVGEGNGNPLQYCLENPVDREACQATVLGIAELDTTERLSLVHSFIWFLSHCFVPGDSLMRGFKT